MSDLQCPRCGSLYLIKKGLMRGKQDYMCKICGVRTINPLKTHSSRKLSSENVLAFGCTHIPFTLKGYQEFIFRTRDKYKCDTIVHLGDLFDNHAISRFTHDPDGWSSGKEFELAKNEAESWYNEIPEMVICRGNHDVRYSSLAKSNGLPKAVLKSFNDVWGLPDSWKWVDDYELNGVRYQHGDGKSVTKYSHANWAVENMQSTVTAHTHSYAGVEYMANKKKLIWGMGVGCGVDRESYAMEYGKNMPRKPIIGCGVITDNGTLPIFIPMQL